MRMSMLFFACLIAVTMGAMPASGWTISFIKSCFAQSFEGMGLEAFPRMTFDLSKLSAISAVELICIALVAGQERVNPQADVMAHFSERVASYLALQKKVEGKLPPQKETNNPEQIKTHVAGLAAGIRAARTDAKAGDI